MRAGDLFGTGTISGPAEGQMGCLLEITRGGKQPLVLSNASSTDESSGGGMAGAAATTTGAPTAAAAATTNQPAQPTGAAASIATRTYLQDGDTVVLRGWCEGEGKPRIGFGECRGRLLPAIKH